MNWSNKDRENPALDIYEEQQIERHRHDYNIKSKAVRAIQNAAVVVDVAKDNLYGHDCINGDCPVCAAIDKLRAIVEEIDDVAAEMERVG